MVADKLWPVAFCISIRSVAKRFTYWHVFIFLFLPAMVPVGVFFSALANGIIIPAIGYGNPLKILAKKKKDESLLTSCKGGGTK